MAPCSGADLSERHVDLTYCLDSRRAVDAKRLTVRLRDGQLFEVPIQDNDAHLFADKNVLISEIKYDDLSWVRQWVEFYVRVHGVTGVLLYNNNATRYTSADIARAVAEVAGLETVAVVDWFFPFGPGAGASGQWDSLFCQTGANENGRYRFLAEARSVIVSDVDELVFCEDPDDSVCTLLEQSKNGFLDYGCKIATFDGGTRPDLSPTERQYRACHFINPHDHRPEFKYSYIPHRIPDSYECRVHTIEGFENDPPIAARLSFRHFPDFNTGWKRQRRYAPKNLTSDPVMERTYRKIGWA